MEKRNTKELILETSLALFNDFGLSRVSTNHIADEMDISPGNLYYHYRNKDDIIFELFKRFERHIDGILSPHAERPSDIEDIWLFLHLIFETVWNYRFLYRSLVDLVNNDKIIRTHFRRILGKKINAAARIYQGLIEDGVMQASPEEVASLSTNVAMVATYWLNFNTVLGAERNEENALALGVYQVLNMVAPYLREPERSTLNAIGEQYL